MSYPDIPWDRYNTTYTRLHQRIFERIWPHPKCQSGLAEMAKC